MSNEIYYHESKTLIDLFNLGMMREYLDILPDVPHDGKSVILNLGPGNKFIHGTIPLELPAWDAEVNDIPYLTNSVDQIHAYHFLEHVQNIARLLKECHRVLKPGSHMNIVVPHYSAPLAYCDLDHKRFFGSEVWKNLTKTDSYTKDKITGFRTHFNMIIGDKEENLALISQLVKN
jgi:predicted SAM-dependent methyltransferase